MIITINNYADFKTINNTFEGGGTAWYYSTGNPGLGTGAFGAYIFAGAFGQQDCLVLQNLSAPPVSFATDFPSAIQLTGPVVSIV